MTMHPASVIHAQKHTINPNELVATLLFRGAPPVRILFLKSVLVVVSLAGRALPALSADFEKLLPDDTDLLLTVNVKQILGSGAFAKHFRPMVEDFLKSETAQSYLKDSGFVPLKDVDRVALVMGRSAHEVEADPNTNHVSLGVTPFLIIQGRFDPPKLQAKAAKLAKQKPGLLKTTQVGGVNVYEFAGPFPAFAAVLDNATVIAGRQSHVFAAIDKASGKKYGELQHKAMVEALASLDPKQSAEWLAIEPTVMGKSVTATNNQKPQIKLQTLGDSGIAFIRVRAMVGDDVKVKAEIVAKDAAQATKTMQMIEQALKEGIKHIQDEAQREKELLPVVDLVKSVKTAAKDRTIILEGQGGADALVGFFKAWFTVREAPRRENPPFPRNGP
jgi:hypothetical protein